MNKWRLAGLAVLLSAWVGGAQADLLLTAAPLFDEQKSKELYEPFAEAMSEILGEKVSYEYPKDWLVYAREMRTGRYDLIFDQAHFASWRLLPQNIFHTTVVRLPGYEKYVVLAKAEDPSFGIADYLGRKICAMPSPALSTMVVLSRFTNPVRQPIMVEAQGGFAEAYQMLLKGQCEAAVVSLDFYEQSIVAEGQSELLKVVFTSNPIPNQVMTITKKHPKDVREKLIEALTDELSPKGADKLFTTFAPGETRFVRVTEQDLKPYDGMLQGVLWGW